MSHKFRTLKSAMLMSLVGLTVAAMWFSASVMADNSPIIIHGDNLAGISYDPAGYAQPSRPPAATSLTWPQQF